MLAPERLKQSNTEREFKQVKNGKNGNSTDQCRRPPVLGGIQASQAESSPIDFYLLQKVFKLFHAALGPSEAALRVTQVGHYESVLPGTMSGTRAAQITRRRRSVVHTTEPVDDGKGVNLNV